MAVYAAESVLGLAATEPEFHLLYAGVAPPANEQARPHAALGVEKAVVNLRPQWRLFALQGQSCLHKRPI